MDLYEAHLLLKIDFKTKLPSTAVWQWMAKIMRARDGHKDWKDLNEEVQSFMRRADVVVIADQLAEAAEITA
jgi:hypothetical protein